MGCRRRGVAYAEPRLTGAFDNLQQVAHNQDVRDAARRLVTAHVVPRLSAGQGPVHQRGVRAAAGIWRSRRYPAIRRLRTLPAAILAIALLTAACGASSTDPTPGNPAPAISGTALDGSSLDLASFKGHPVVVNFWASWCVPCRDEFPVFKDELAAHASDGLVVLGVLYKDQADLGKSFSTDFGATWPTVTDPNGSIADAYRIAAPPETFFIDKGGVIRGVQIGAMTADTFATQYAKIAS